MPLHPAGRRTASQHNQGQGRDARSQTPTYAPGTPAVTSLPTVAFSKLNDDGAKGSPVPQGQAAVISWPEALTVPVGHTAAVVNWAMVCHWLPPGPIIAGGSWFMNRGS
jgi:hypothetical protein